MINLSIKHYFLKSTNCLSWLVIQVDKLFSLTDYSTKTVLFRASSNT